MNKENLNKCSNSSISLMIYVQILLQILRNVVVVLQKGRGRSKVGAKKFYNQTTSTLNVVSKFSMGT